MNTFQKLDKLKPEVGSIVRGSGDIYHIGLIFNNGSTLPREKGIIFIANMMRMYMHCEDVYRYIYDSREGVFYHPLTGERQENLTSHPK